MFRFTSDQKVADINGVKIGGQPGEYPTVLISTIFYDGHKIVRDNVKGEFDRARAEDLIRRHEELSDETGSPFILDIVGSSEQAMRRYIEFVTSVTDRPFLMDSGLERVRIDACKYVSETGLVKKAIYNTISIDTTEAEMRAIKEAGIESAVVLLYDPRKLRAVDKPDVLKGYGDRPGLLARAEDAGIKNALIDIGVMDTASISTCAKAIYLIKDALGLPCGCAPANALFALQKVRKDKALQGIYCAATNTMLQSLGADFTMLGPVEACEPAFRACSLNDALIAYAARELRTRPQTRDHPIFKVLR